MGPSVLQLAEIGGLPALLLDRLDGWQGVAIEIAIGALGQAEGPVDVGREIGISRAVL
jgi:hypothetical protein